MIEQLVETMPKGRGEDGKEGYDYETYITKLMGGQVNGTNGAHNHRH